MKVAKTTATTLLAQTRYGVFDAFVRYELLGAEGVVGRFFPSVYPFDAYSASDFVVFGVSKVVLTPTTTEDILALSASTTRSDVGQATDFYTAFFGKTFADAPTVADALDYTKLTVITPVTDLVATMEVVSKTATRPEADVVYSFDVFNVVLAAIRANLGLAADSGQLLNQDYVNNSSYFADDYVGVKRIF